MSLIFLFVDGIGLGEEDDHNPFVSKSYEAFERLSGGQLFSCNAKEVLQKQHLFKQVDATLGIEGLPQSGTGQTTLFTGENASKAIDKHFGPFPHSGIKHLLREQSLFIKAQQLGYTCHFINGYPDIFFEKSRKRNRWSCTTLMTKSAGLPLNNTGAVKSGKAVTAGLTQKGWREKLQIDVPEISAERAAFRLLQRSRDYDLLLHEYYLTDKAGHSQEQARAERILTTYNNFLLTLMKEKEKEDTVVLCSDHGNLEDLSTKTHTLNKVPLFVLGPQANVFRTVESITDVTPAILASLNA